MSSFIFYVVRILYIRLNAESFFVYVAFAVSELLSVGYAPATSA